MQDEDYTYFALYRKIINSPVFKNADLLKMWIWILSKSSYTERQEMHGITLVDLKKGDFIFGRKTAAVILNMNESTVYKYLKWFEKQNMITVNSNNKFSVVTVVNWELYQTENRNRNNNVTTKEQQRNNNVTTKEQQRNTNNKDNKDNKVLESNKDKYISVTFVPPTHDQVFLYCTERNNSVDVDKFIDFYSAKGWMIGRNKMKDWKAAVRTWEKNNYQEGVKNEFRSNNKEISGENKPKYGLIL